MMIARGLIVHRGWMLGEGSDGCTIAWHKWMAIIGLLLKIGLLLCNNILVSPCDLNQNKYDY